MLKDWLGHQHSRSASLVHRAPAAVKLALALTIIMGTVVVPLSWRVWFVVAASCLVLTAMLARLSLLFLFKRLLVLSPFVLGVLLVNAFQPTFHGARGGGPGLVVRSAICLFAVVLLSNTTPFGQVLAVLRRARVPVLLVTTLALMHRYLYVLLDESERLRRARASRTFGRRRRARWQVLGTVVGQLFVRASERAERIYAAMCARGWK
jgi:cobalt/nickel transport system permease protein